MSATASPRGVVFLFGAGASFAVGEAGGHVSPTLPPLMVGLYDRLAKEFPKEWGPTSPPGRHADAFRKDFEAAFQLLRTDYLQPPLTLLDDLVPLALHFAGYSLGLGGDDLYSRLLAGLRDAGVLEGTTFGSLNYECLLEQAAEQMGLGIDWLLDEAWLRLQAERTPLPRRPNAIRVAKLHGSCNFVTDLDQRGRAMACSPGSAIETPIRAIVPTELKWAGKASRVFGREGCFPIMSQVSPSKEQWLAPAKMTQIRSMWSEAVMSADQVVVIGVAPKKGDAHVWGPLQETKAPRLYIGAAKDFDEWCAPNKAGWQHLAERWETADTVLGSLRLAAA